MKKVLLTVLSLTVLGGAFAQVTFYDYNPNEELHATYAGESINIDFDNDQSPELTLFGTKHDTVIAGVFSTTLTGFAISTYGNTEILGRTTTLQSETVLEADTLLLGNTIDLTSTYVSSSTPSVFPGVGLTAIEAVTSTTAGQFAGAGYRYIGVRFDISGSTHFGWIRVMVSATHDTCIVDSYAYETTALTAIDAGDLGGGFVSVSKPSFESGISVLENQFQLTGLSGANVKVYNVLGEIEISKKINSDKAFIATDKLASGVYLVSCHQDTKVITYKVYKP